MAIAIFVGLVSGTIGALCWAATHFIINLPGVYNRLEGHWFLVPPAFGMLAATMYFFSQARASGRNDPNHFSKRPARISSALVDLFEGYHFGLFIKRPMEWLSRGIITLLNSFLGGTFGLEGAILELSFAALPGLSGPLFSRVGRLFVEERQTIVVCALASALAVALGAPFSGALIALSLIQVLEPKVRTGGFVSALTAYGTTMFIQSTLLLGFSSDTAHGERMTVIGALFSGLKPLDLELVQWPLLMLAAAIVGVITAAFGTLTSRVLSKGDQFFNRFFGSKVHLRMLVTGLVMGVSVYLLPETFTEPWRVWEDVAWMRFSSAYSVLILAGEWTLFVLAFSGWGSVGLFSPMLTLGALLGYAAGNQVSSAWAVPLAIAGAVSCLSSAYAIPLAASALVLELGRDGSIWWLSTIAIVSGTVLVRFFDLKSLQERLLERRGTRIVAGCVANVLAGLRVEEVVFRDVPKLPENASVEELRAAIAASRHGYVGILSRDGKYLGLLALQQIPSRIRRALMPGAKTSEIKAVERVLDIRELIEVHTPSIAPNDTLEKALRLLQEARCLPVVDEHRVLSGILFEHAVVSYYKRETSGAIF